MSLWRTVRLSGREVSPFCGAPFRGCSNSVNVCNEVKAAMMTDLRLSQLNYYGQMRCKALMLFMPLS
jgi:hypothetical protein